MNETITETELLEAERRWEMEVGCFPAATQARFDRAWRRIIISLENELDLALDPTQFKCLDGASDDALSNIELWASGYDLYFPALDEDIYLPHVFRDKFPKLEGKKSLVVLTHDIAA